MHTVDAKRVLETALICAQQPLPLRDLRALFDGNLGADTLKDLLLGLQQEWVGRGVELVQVASGWRFQSRPEMRAFLDKHVPSEGALEAEADVDEAHELLESGDTQAALSKMADALAADPTNDDARFDYVRLLIATGGYEEADALLQEPLKRIPQPLRFDALWRWLDALQFVQNDDRGNWPLEQFDALIAQNKRDFDTRFAKARVLMAEGEWAAAMEELLEIIMRDKTWNAEAPRKTYVAILELLTPPQSKPDPAAAGKTAAGIELVGKTTVEQDETTAMLNAYRRKLSMALN